MEHSRFEKCAPVLGLKPEGPFVLQAAALDALLAKNQKLRNPPGVCIDAGALYQ